MIVVADTSPLNYLILIGHIDLLPQIFGAVNVPPAVWHELNDPRAPLPVREWTARSPEWLVQAHVAFDPGDLPDDLERGEQEAIALAELLHADRLLVDESRARKAAMDRDIPVIGTLGVLNIAAAAGLIDLTEAFAKLRETTFYASSELFLRLLNEDARRRS
jgi:predicted nucleic acid-binding protein